MLLPRNIEREFEIERGDRAPRTHRGEWRLPPAQEEQASRRPSGSNMNARRACCAAARLWDDGAIPRLAALAPASSAALDAPIPDTAWGIL